MQLCSVPILLLKLLLLQLSAIEHISGVIDHYLKVGLHLKLGHLFNSLPEILSSKHDVLDVLQRDGQQSNRVDSPSTVSDLVHGQAVNLIQDATALFYIFNLNVLIFESEEQFNLTCSEDVDFIVVLVLLENFVAKLEDLRLDMEDELFVGFKG